MDPVFDVVLALGDFAADFRELVGERREALERRREVGGVAVQAFADAREQRLQERARFGVERGEEFVEVAVGRGLRDRDRVPAGHAPGGGVAGGDLDRLILQPGLGTQQRRGVAVDVLGVLGRQVHADQRPAAPQFHI